MKLVSVFSLAAGTAQACSGLQRLVPAYDSRQQPTTADVYGPESILVQFCSSRLAGPLGGGAKAQK